MQIDIHPILVPHPYVWMIPKHQWYMLYIWYMIYCMHTGKSQSLEFWLLEMNLFARFTSLLMNIEFTCCTVISQMCDNNVQNRINCLYQWQHSQITVVLLTFSTSFNTLFSLRQHQTLQTILWYIALYKTTSCYIELLSVNLFTD